MVFYIESIRSKESVGINIRNEFYYVGICSRISRERAVGPAGRLYSRQQAGEEPGTTYSVR
jgi:hypothetical protein